VALLKAYRFGLAVALLLAPAPAWPAAATSPPIAASEYQVKAAFLYNFTKFVEWPPSAFQNESAPFLVCIVGDNPFGEDLRQVVHGQKVGGRELMLLGKGTMADPTGCHLLFLGRSERERTAEVLAAVRDANVLTVGETEGFLEQGGVIRFTLQDGKVRFEISPEAAQRAGLKMSSKLLRLANLRGGQ
jgi:hypothetical protein